MCNITIINDKKQYKSYKQCSITNSNKASTFQRKTDFNGRISNRNKSFDKLIF